MKTLITKKEGEVVDHLELADFKHEVGEQNWAGYYSACLVLFAIFGPSLRIAWTAAFSTPWL